MVILPLTVSHTLLIIEHSTQGGDQPPVDHLINLPTITHHSPQADTTPNRLQPGTAIITVPEEILRNVNSAS